MSLVRKFGPCVLAFLISLATFSGAGAEGRRALSAGSLRDPAPPPLARLWEWLLGWLPSEAPAGEPPPPGGGDAGEGGEGDPGNPGGLGPEMDPNGNPAPTP
jgi:hypothetical protein